MQADLKHTISNCKSFVPSFDEYFSAFKLQKVPPKIQNTEEADSEFSQAIDIGVDSENEGLQKQIEIKGEKFETITQ